MPPRLSIPTYPRQESSSPILPTTAPNAGPSQPARHRAWSVAVPDPATNQDRTANPALPITTPASPTNAQPRRSRAHTVSVSMRSARRSPTDPRRPSFLADLESGRAGRPRSPVDRRRDSIEQQMTGDNEITPVSFDLPDEGGQLHDEAVGLLDVIDDHVSTGMSKSQGGM